MKTSVVRILSIITIPLIILSLFFAVYYLKNAKRTASLPDYGVAPAFQLMDSTGAGFDSAAFAGKPWLGSFLFTRCPDQCPLMVMKLKKISKQLPNLKMVSISVDPDFDKPEILAEYIKRGVGPQNWMFLTGAKDEIKNVAQGFMTAAPDNPSLHSTRFILVDANGHIRGFYDSESREQLNALMVDVRGL